MEGLLNTYPSQRCVGPPFFSNQKIIPLITTPGHAFPCKKIDLGFNPKTYNRSVSRNQASKKKDIGANDKTESDMDWEAEFLGGYSKKEKNEQQSLLLAGTEQMDWCVRARRMALKSIEARGLTPIMKAMVTKKKKNKVKKKLVSKREFAISKSFDIDQDQNDLFKETVSSLTREVLEEDDGKTMDSFVKGLSGPSDRKKEINLNKSLVEAQTADEVLGEAHEAIMAVGKGLSPSPLSPLNIATALHRIAKHMEKVSMMSTHRLAFARRKEMSMLVGIAMAALGDCSAQGISNISWALSKIGGELIYVSEMDRVAEVAITKVEDFNSQNVANLAGAFASMRHSAPELFTELSKRASNIIETFQEQEIAQILWAFASLFEPADYLLESIDSTFREPDQVKCCINVIRSKQAASTDDDGDDIYDEKEEKEDNGSVGYRRLNFNRNELGNIAWSYAVLDQMERIFFNHVWKSLKQFEEHRISERYREDMIFASQVLLVNRCLNMQHPYLDLCFKSEVEENIVRASKTKRFNQKKSSSFQKEVARLLVSTGLEWVREYDLHGYSLDAVLSEQKVGLEIDGPTHFSRNSAVPLGHAMLKRRYIAAAGWKLITVAHHEWEEYEGEFEKLQYLRELLKENLGQPNPDALNEEHNARVMSEPGTA